MTHYLTAISAAILFYFFSVTIHAADDAEMSAWQEALSVGDVGSFEQFLEQYPESEFSGDAKALLASIQPDNEPVPESVSDEAPSEAGMEQSMFEQPIAEDVLSDSPRSIKQLSEGTPQFPPVDGLPEEYWKGEVCSNCHAWDEANLCVQGEYFVSRDQAAIDRIEHPYGGFFKQALKLWAAGGCE